MQQFDARVTYYVHAFSAIQDWFGDRGVAIIDGDLREWCCDGYFLYWQCNPSAPNELQGDHIDDVVYACDNSMYYEPTDFMPYNKSPFANKLTTLQDTMELEKHQASPELLMHFKALLAIKERLRQCIELNDKDEELREIYAELNAIIKQDDTL